MMNRPPGYDALQQQIAVGEARHAANQFNLALDRLTQLGLRVGVDVQATAEVGCAHPRVTVAVTASIDL